MPSVTIKFYVFISAHTHTLTQRHTPHYPLTCITHTYTPTTTTTIFEYFRFGWQFSVFGLSTKCSFACTLAPLAQKSQRKRDNNKCTAKRSQQRNQKEHGKHTNTHTQKVDTENGEIALRSEVCYDFFARFLPRLISVSNRWGFGRGCKPNLAKIAKYCRDLGLRTKKKRSKLSI